MEQQENTHVRRNRRTKRRVWPWIVASVIALFFLAVACSGDSEPESQDPSPVVEASPEPTVEPESEPVVEETTEPEPAPEPELTMAQEQAIGSAGSYLSFTAFSRTGLIEQLEFEGFTTDEATFAVDYLDVDWKEQAAKSAESYLEMTNFSRSRLIEQLKFEGFTTEQAEYGVSQAGL